ncbi:MAG: hypothetical protein KAU28_04930, partial [Phycisphaerae bacterium]|nr:hypothetical protein [Phycisphaerae bacterium]
LLDADVFNGFPGVLRSAGIPATPIKEGGTQERFSQYDMAMSVQLRSLRHDPLGVPSERLCAQRGNPPSRRR